MVAFLNKRVSTLAGAIVLVSVAFIVGGILLYQSSQMPETAPVEKLVIPKEQEESPPSRELNLQNTLLATIPESHDPPESIRRTGFLFALCKHSFSAWIAFLIASSLLWLLEMFMVVHQFIQ